MAGIKIDNFAVGDVNLTAIMDTLQGLRQGHFQASLTEMDTTTIPKVAAGSIFDLNGSLVYVDADETIGGTPVDGVTYIKAIYSSGTVSFEWTATAPTFSTSKNGWYGTSASSGHRYIAKMIKASSSYTGKTLYDSANIPYIYESKTTQWIGTWNAGASQVATLTFSLNVQAIIAIDVHVWANTTNNIYIESVVISTNTIQITMYHSGRSSGNYTSSGYHIFITAAL